MSACSAPEFSSAVDTKSFDWTGLTGNDLWRMRISRGQTQNEIANDLITNRVRYGAQESRWNDRIAPGIAFGEQLGSMYLSTLILPLPYGAYEHTKFYRRTFSADNLKYVKRVFDFPTNVAMGRVLGYTKASMSGLINGRNSLHQPYAVAEVAALFLIDATLRELARNQPSLISTAAYIRDDVKTILADPRYALDKHIRPRLPRRILFGHHNRDLNNVEAFDPFVSAYDIQLLTWERACLSSLTINNSNAELHCFPQAH